MGAPLVICLGMNEESRTAIDALVGSGARIVAIAGLPREAASGVSDFVDLSSTARANGIPWLPITDVNAPAARTAFAETGADMLFILGWSQLLKAEVASVFRKGVVGSHPSMLPEGRGRAPIPWTILQDLRQSAVTLFQVGPGVDDGQILKQLVFEIPERPTARIVYDLVANKLSEAFVTLYSEVATETVRPHPQNEAQASWRSKRVPDDGWIDFRSSAVEIDRLVRAVSEPFPGAYSYLNNEKAIFWTSAPATGADLRRHGLPGQVLARREGYLLVQAGDQPLWLSEPDLPIERDVFLRLGDRFGFRIEDELHSLRGRVDELERVVKGMQDT